MIEKCPLCGEDVGAYHNLVDVLDAHLWIRHSFRFVYGYTWREQYADLHAAGELEETIKRAYIAKELGDGV